MIKYIIILSLFLIAEPIRNVHFIKGNTAKWHAWQMFTNILFFVPFYFVMDCRIVTAFGFIFWQLHDSIIGYALHKDVFYLGENKIDSFTSSVFQGGKTMAFLRLTFMAFFVYDYLIHTL